jgi:DNA-binding transcriptional ArsR family regulator
MLSITPSSMAQAELSVIEAWDVAASILDPSRREILERLLEPDSATGVARALGLPRQRVAYHVRELERHGLVEPVAERRRGNCVERVVQSSARRYIISPAALEGLSVDPAEAGDALSSAYLIAAAAQTIREVAALRQAATTANQRLSTLTLQLDIRFASAAARGAFADELAQFLAASARKYHEPDAAGGRSYRFTVTGYPAPASSPTTNPKGTS